MNRRFLGAMGVRVVLGVALSACSAAPSAPVVVSPAAVSSASSAASPSESTGVAAVEPDPAPRYEEALAESVALATEFDNGPDYNDDKWQALREARHLDERHVRRLLDAVAAPCVAAWLATSASDGPACKAIKDHDGPAGKATQALVVMLGRVAQLDGTATPSIRTLLRLDEVGLWRASMAITDVLERRARDHADACPPPTSAEIDAARRSLTDLAVVDVERGRGRFARWPTPAEVEDLAYFYAATADARPEVGVREEDLTTPALPPTHPDLARRAALRTALKQETREVDLDRHLRTTEAYLATLGYPGPLRLLQEGDERWGGSGASYLMRAAATEAEILGRFDVAETYYRRATPGGGSCGTSTAPKRATQIEGVIRVAELAHSCRRVIAERLYAPQAAEDSPYGPEPLARAGYDVTRLYAGALLTMGREDVGELDRMLLALPSRGADALARRQRMGQEAWATRVRAIGGLADAAKGASLPRLLGIAEAGTPADRVEALRILGELAEDHGFDPCLPAHFGRMWGHSSNGEREVKSVMMTCATRIPAPVLDGAARRIEALATDPEPKVREAAAAALGRMGMSRSRGTLAKLVRDTFDLGGTVCWTEGDKPEVCEPNRPVARAAKDALARLKEADAERAEQRAGKRR